MLDVDERGYGLFIRHIIFTYYLYVNLGVSYYFSFRNQ